MYGVSSYFIATWLANTILMIWYPLVIGIIRFYLIGFDDASFSSFMNWIKILYAMSLAGGSFGYIWAALVKD